jgi:hypothetical protein
MFWRLEDANGYVELVPSQCDALAEDGSDLCLDHAYLAGD